jgi:hypothetical protein
METPISEQLLGEMQDKPIYYSFGANIAETTEESIKRGDSVFPQEAYEAIASLTGRLRKLRRSDESVDSSARRNALSSFATKDFYSLNLDPVWGKFSVKPDREDIFGWLIDRADYHDIAHFMVWMRNRRANMEHRLNELRPRLQDGVIEKVEFLIGEDIFPKKETVDLYMDTFDYYGNLKAMDSIESGIKNAAGYCMENEDGSGTIAVASQVIPSSNFGYTYDIEEVVFHEDTHGVGRDRGFFNGIAQRHTLRMLEEFFVQHLSAITTKRDSVPGYSENGPHVIDPDRRRDLFLRYVTERKYFNLLLQDAVSVDQLGHTYVSDPNTVQGAKLRIDLENKIFKAAGGQEVFYALADQYEDAKSQLTRDNILGRAMWDLNHQVMTEDVPMDNNLADVIQFAES